MVKIREAAPADATLIVDLAQQTWWPTYSEILSDEQITYMLQTIYNPAKIEQQIATGEQHYLILEEDSQPVGFAAYSPREENPEIYKLHKLYCLPQTQGKGYGKLLINTVAEKVRQAGKHILELNVNRYNKALNFYEKMGFIIAYEEDIAIGPYWMNDFVMRKELSV
ncbi:GNAT family N-acetyltransferase [Mucilaginibacter sp. Bleaf8]|uniref:GNAT family N-acetyltransferase n=1 Tax=Mucilaginibacter sp. Bleaf8 TaxID=2834430 RepID=UPI001BCBE587|nr:GNAT family N-acetyltransferase [Mucilaginibacter sp. Bleaf8]MBS7564328.1 GNAT family N-acetyltransferase [Mucilaginibacter sp. Bleaf8]